MATKKPVAKKTATKKPAAKAAPAKTAPVKAAVKQDKGAWPANPGGVKAPAAKSAVQPISKTNPPAKTAVFSQKQVASLKKVNEEAKVVAKQVAANGKEVARLKGDLVKKGTNKVKQIEREVKLNERIADHATATGDVATGERLRRSGHDLKKIGETIKAKVNEIAADPAKHAQKPPQPVKKAALVAPSPTGQQQQQHRPKQHHHHRPHGKPASAPPAPSGTDIWNRSLGIERRAQAPAPAPTPNEELKALLRRPTIHTGNTVVPDQRPALPPSVAKEPVVPAAGSMSASDMKSVIAQRTSMPPSPAFDIKSMPFKTRQP